MSSFHLNTSCVSRLPLICALFVFASACAGENPTVPSKAPETPISTAETVAAPAVSSQMKDTETASAEGSPAPSSADVMKRGAKLYKRCVSCHTLKEGERHKVGPNLWAVYGATAGMREGFSYSKAMKNSNIVWTDETLDAYIANPKKYMPGNRMTYTGLRKAQDRDALFTYIKAQTTP